MTLLPGKANWPKRMKKKWRTSVHYEDPVVERQCRFCNRINKWPVSATEGGKEVSCRCGAVFCAWNNPPWRVK